MLDQKTRQELLTIIEVAERLRCSKYAIYGYVQRGLLPAVRLTGGSKFLFKPADVDALLAKHRVGDAAAGMCA